MSYAQARAITRVATAEKAELWIAYAKRLPASQLDKLCRSYENVQAYDQAHGAGAMAGAIAAAHVAAQRTVTRRTLDNGMVKFEAVLPSDEAAIVWAALNAALDTSRAKSNGAEPTPAEPTPAEHSPDNLPTAKAPTSADRGRQRADAFMDIIQDRIRGTRPQRTPVEIFITIRLCEVH